MNTEIMKSEPQQLEAVNPMNILQLAISQDASIEKISQLMDMQDRWEANTARKAFVKAMADFKLEAIVITKDKANKQYDSRYSSIGNIINTVTPLLSKHGLSASFELDQSAGIKVSCTLTHALGHSKTNVMQVPLDTSGAKNPLQQIKSSITYARIVTFEMACGIASAEGNSDDDANGSAPKGSSMDPDEYERLRGLIETAGSRASLKSIYFAALKDAQEIGDQAAINVFAKIKDARYKELA
jgi:hypothetical protein